MKGTHVVTVSVAIVLAFAAVAMCYTLTHQENNEVTLTSYEDMTNGRLSDFKFSTADGLVDFEEGLSLTNPIKLVYTGEGRAWDDVSCNKEYGMAYFLYSDDDGVFMYTICLLDVLNNSISTSMESGNPVLEFTAKGKFNMEVHFGDVGGEDDDEDPSIIKCYVTTHDTGFDENVVIPAYYSDSYFSSPSTELNYSLLDFALCLEMSSGLDSSDHTKRSSSVVQLLGDIGCDRIKVNDTYVQRSTTTSVDVAIGSKQIDGSTVIFLVMNGAHYTTEFVSNVMLGESGNHEGFSLVRDQAVNFLRHFITENGITGDVKILVTGFSRTAAGSNLIAAYLSDAIAEGKVKERIGDINLTKEDVYGFSFETPRCGYYEEGCGLPAPTDERYSNIWYVINPDDLVTYVPPEQYGFVRYGNEVTIQSHDAYSTRYMLSFVEQYLDKEAAAHFDMSGFISISGVDSLQDWNEGMIPKLFDALGSREHYANDIQDDIVDFMYVLMNNPAVIQELIDASGGTMKMILKLYSNAGKEKSFKSTFGPIVDKALNNCGLSSYSDSVLNGLYQVSKLVNDYAHGNKLNLISDKYIGSMIANSKYLIVPHSTIMCLGYLSMFDKNYDVTLQ